MIPYRELWNLQRPPFEAVADPAFFFESQAHGEALARLLYFAADRGMGLAVLTGEIGSGKTMTLAAFRARLPPDRFAVVDSDPANLPFDDILRGAIARLSAPDRPRDVPLRTYDLLEEFQRLLRERIQRTGRHLLMILDEAQVLDPATVDQIKGLTNLNAPGRPVLSLVLAGQPELKENLRRLPQVFQRIGMLFHLGYLSREELPSYLAHRLRAAGADQPETFAEECHDPLFAFSRGCPRQINRICKLAVDRACLLKEKVIHATMIRMIADDFERQFA